MKSPPFQSRQANSSSSRRLIRRTIAVGSWLALASVVAIWITLQFGDDWWPATLIMFLPRWIWALFPALMVAPARWVIGVRCFQRLRRWVWPWAQSWGFASPGDRSSMLRPNMTNFGSSPATCIMGKRTLGFLDSLIEETHPDVIALQEWRDSAHSKFLENGDWHVERQNALFLASRFPIVKAVRQGRDSSSPQGSAMRYELLTPEGIVNIISLHLESPRDGLGQVAGTRLKNNDGIVANSEQRRIQSEFLAAAASRIPGPLLVVGDFNTPPESVFFGNIWTGYRDAFNDAGLGWGHTFFNRATSVRIDHILIGGGGRASHCWVGRNVGSPHRPVIADISWPLSHNRK